MRWSPAWKASPTWRCSEESDEPESPLERCVGLKAFPYLPASGRVHAGNQRCATIAYAESSVQDDSPDGLAP